MTVEVTAAQLSKIPVVSSRHTDGACFTFHFMDSTQNILPGAYPTFPVLARVGQNTTLVTRFVIQFFILNLIISLATGVTAFPLKSDMLEGLLANIHGTGY